MAALEREGITSELRDYQLHTTGRPFELDDVVRFTLEDSSNIIGFSAMINVLPHLVRLLQEVKRLAPQKTIILGGPGPSSVAKPLLERYPVADVVVLGEGEGSLPLVLNALRRDEEKLNDIPGLLLKKSGGITATGSAPRLVNLGNLPFPAYSAVDLQQYNGAIPLELARGCPFSCAFCETCILWGRRVHVFSPKRVLSIVRSVTGQSSHTHFGFVDDSFGVQREAGDRLLEGLEGLDVTWHCSTRLEFVSEAWIGKLHASGCRQIFVGAESGSDAVLEAIGKRGVAASEILSKVGTLQAGIGKVTASLMWGFPFESLQDLADTLSLAADLRSIGAIAPLHLLCALPSSSLTAEYRASRRFDPRLIPDISAAHLTRSTVALIEEDPEVFSSFYYFDHPTFDLKLKTVRHFEKSRRSRK
jgi:radical SAM superfamily enzyme YgiQ (UPF0313 family)